MENITITPPFQTSFNIKTNCEKLIRLIRLKYGKYVTNSKSYNTKNILAVKKGETYVIRFFDKTVCDKSGITAIDEIISDNTIYNENIFALHGAAIEYGGKAYIFLASTTSGKSTLTSYLTNHGFGYITDDCILLGKTNFEVYPYNTPIHLREGGFKILKALNAEPDNFEIIDDEKFERYVYSPANCIDNAAPLDKIFFIRRTENNNSISLMSTTERMTNLMKSPITLYSVTSEYLKFISKLAAKDCYNLSYCNMAYIAEVLKNE